jgi:hypothetical protein
MVLYPPGRFVWLLVDIRKFVGIVNINKVFTEKVVHKNPANYRLVK